MNPVRYAFEPKLSLFEFAVFIVVVMDREPWWIAIPVFALTLIITMGVQGSKVYRADDE